MFWNVYHQTLKYDLKTILIGNHGRSLNSTIYVYDLVLLKQWHTKIGVTPSTWRTFFLLLTYYFFVFIMMLIFVYLQKRLNFSLIVNSFKTIPSFSPCPWKLRWIRPSVFKWKNVRKELLYWLVTFSQFK